ncbi:hypothetical protein R3P38DRAFT_1841054 [Favolaschia claudopus]|uniref:Nephrocystin 3-like N-terminal domain-containing protein n=1 Tax=Favolaschia claudopus TaxID=2862362 RepID=A0AAW0A4D0_9AGAR
MAKVYKFWRWVRRLIGIRPLSRSDETKTGPLPEYLSVLKDGLLLLLNRTEGFLDGTPFKIPFSAVNTAVELANAVSDNKNELQSLSESIAHRLAIVNSNFNHKTESKESKNRIISFSRELKLDLDAVGALSNRGIIRRLLKADADAKTIADTFRRIDEHLKDFQIDLTIAIDRKLDRANVEAAMRTLYAASSNEASYDWGNNYDRPSCHPKTREEYLLKLEAWSQEDCPGLFWMYGPAGTGKSAIMQSFCEQMHQESRLGASFFFKRDHPSRRDAMKVFPTLAYHLARASPELEVAIATIVGEDPAIFSQTLAIQLQKLIIGPCQTVTLASPWVIAIDGLDECGGGQNSQQAILRTIGNAHDQLKTSRLTILIASRPEPDIESVFNEPCLTFAQRLEIRGSETDVRTYLVDQFQRIRATYECLCTAPMLWPGDKIVEDFVRQSSGHFVYASTVVKFIDDKDWNPEGRLKLILGIRGNPISSALTPAPPGPFFALDQLYKGILADVPNQERLLTILPAIAANFKFQFSVVQMGQLLELEPTTIQTTLRRLHSLINVPAIARDKADCITVHHASFLDFLNDPARSAHFHFDSIMRHSLALRILKVYSEASEHGCLAFNHVYWQLDLAFLATTQLSPDMIDSLRQVNDDLVFNKDIKYWELLQWLKDQDAPVDLIRQWEDHASIWKFEKILDDAYSSFYCVPDKEDWPEALWDSPKLTQIIQTAIIIRSGGWATGGAYMALVATRYILDYSWEEMQTAVTPILSLKYPNARNLCLKISSPSHIQELNSDQTLQRLAERCMEIICWDRVEQGQAISFIELPWSYLLRASSPTIQLLETVQRLLVLTKEDLAPGKDFIQHVHNVLLL